MLISLPLGRQSVEMYNTLLYRCDYGDQTHKLYEYSQVLYNIRRMPGCANKHSVEDCDGYEPAPPYTTFLKDLENSFRCSGFCYQPNPAQASAGANVSAPGANASAPPSGAKAPAGENASAPAPGANAKKSKNKSAPAKTSLMQHTSPNAKSLNRHYHHK